MAQIEPIPVSQGDNDTNSDDASSTTSYDIVEEQIGEDGLTSRQRFERDQEAAVNAILTDNSLSETAQIDSILKARNCFLGDTTTIDTYLSGQLTAAETAAKIAAPIDEAYTTADHGRMYYESERVARIQRKYHSPEKALGMWGPEEDFPEPDPETRKLPTTEGQLWELWYAILHAAKQIPWTDDTQQGKLLDLVRALKGRPDPPPPERMTVALKRDWIWSTGRLWSELLMLGPSATETWNDQCGTGSGWTLPERRAWANVNAFVARLTGTELADFRRYGLGALSDALEDNVTGEGTHRNTDRVTQLTLFLIMACVWIKFAGEYMYQRRSEDDEKDGQVDVSWRGEKLPWYRKEDISAARWEFWRMRLVEEGQNQELAEDVRELALDCARMIQSWKTSAGVAPNISFSRLGTMIMATPSLASDW